MTKFPAYRLPGRIARLDVEAQCRPIPPVAAEAIPELVASHQKLADRYGHARARQLAAQQAVDKVEQDDSAAARKAVTAGKPVPPAKVPAARAELDEATRELDAVTSLIGPSAREMLAAAVPLAEELEERAAAAARDLEQHGQQLLRDARSEFEAAAASSAAAAWLAELRTTGRVPPWNSRVPPSALAGAVGRAVGDVEYELVRRVERVAEAAHEARAANVVRRGDVLVDLPPPGHAWVVPGGEPEEPAA